MSSELAIFTFAAGVVALVYATGRVSVRPSRLSRLLAAVRLGVSRLLSLREGRDRRCFLIGIAAGALFAVLCNLVPFFYTNGASGTDGVEVIGFPLVFRGAGGFVFTTHFYWLHFFADLLFAAIVCLVGGYAAIGIRTMFTSRGHKDDGEHEAMG